MYANFLAVRELHHVCPAMLVVSDDASCDTYFRPPPNRVFFTVRIALLMNVYWCLLIMFTMAKRTTDAVIERQRVRQNARTVRCGLAIGCWRKQQATTPSGAAQVRSLSLPCTKHCLPVPLDDVECVLL